MTITFDRERNTLRFELAAGTPAAATVVMATLEIGEGGRLAGIELPPGALRAAVDLPGLDAAADGSAYLTIDPTPGRHLRAATVPLTLELGADGSLLALALPRRTGDYELTWPVGNQ